MPVYEYKCPNCKRVFENYESLHEKNDGFVCKHCHIKCKKLISLTSFILEGKDWPSKEFKNKKE